MHTTLKKVELLKHFKIRKLLQHVSVYKETIIRLHIMTREACVHSTHASRVIICSHNTDNVLYEHYVSTLNQVCNFS